MKQQWCRYSRRKWFESLVAGLTASQLARSAQVSSQTTASNKFAMPGPFRGRVVEVEHAGSIVSGAYQKEPVRQMIERGMRELTGAPDWTAAWKFFFEKGDVVGLKVNPVGRPHVVSAPEVVRTIIEGLNSAGIPNKDIVVYDRYQQEFLEVGFEKWLPEGVRWMAATKDYDSTQQRIDGYDPDHYMDMALTLPGHDISNLTARRSYVAQFITKHVSKLVNLTCLKDHQSAGVTLALKNLSHGLVNNVSRSHSSSTLNACGAFIPAVCSLPVIRNKAVVHIVDGVLGLYHGGPSSNNKKQFVWEEKKMWFATDPVAIDRVGWKAIDAKRAAVGMPPIAQAKPDQWTSFLNRQPEHVEICGAFGLGEWDEKKIDVRKIKLG